MIEINIENWGEICCEMCLDTVFIVCGIATGNPQDPYETLRLCLKCWEQYGLEFAQSKQSVKYGNLC